MALRTLLTSAGAPIYSGKGLIPNRAPNGHGLFGIGGVPPVFGQSMYKSRQQGLNSFSILKCGLTISWASYFSTINPEKKPKDEANPTPAPTMFSREFQASTAPQDTGQHKYLNREYLRETYKEVANVMSMSLLRWVGLVLGIAGFTLYIFWEKIKDWWGAQGADVATRSLADEELLRNARELLKRVTVETLKQQETISELQGFLKGFLSNPDTLIILQTFLNDVLQSPSIQKSTKEFVAVVLADLLRDPNTRDIATKFFMSIFETQSFQDSANELVKKVLKSQSTLDATILLLKNLINDDSIRNNYLIPLARDIVASESVVRQAGVLSKDSVHGILDDDRVHQHATVFVQSVLADPKVKEEGANAIREMVKNAISVSTLLGFSSSKPTQASAKPQPPTPTTPPPSESTTNKAEDIPLSPEEPPTHEVFFVTPH